MNLKTSFDTKKLYYGFPIVVIGYKDDIFGHNITTISSSYSLGDMMVIGMIEDSNASRQIQRFKNFTVNLSSEEMMKSIEGAGFLSGENKLDILNIDYTILPQTETPCLVASPITLECEVVDVIKSQGYVNFIAKILYRYVDSSLLKEDGTLDSEKLSPVYFAGDSSQRIYRYFDSKKSHFLGDYFEEK